MTCGKIYSTSQHLWMGHAWFVLSQRIPVEVINCGFIRLGLLMYLSARDEALLTMCIQLDECKCWLSSSLKHMVLPLNKGGIPILPGIKGFCVCWSQGAREDEDHFLRECPLYDSACVRFPALFPGNMPSTAVRNA